MSLPIEGVVVNWFSHHGVILHAGERLALAIVVLLLGIALLKLVMWLLTPGRNKDESERDYWRMHGG